MPAVKLSRARRCKEVVVGRAAEQGLQLVLRFSHGWCSGSPTGAVAGQPAALPAAVTEILNPNSGKPSVQV